MYSTPLHTAWENGSTETADILLEAGADPTLNAPKWASASVLRLTSGSEDAHVRHTHNSEEMFEI